MERRPLKQRKHKRERERGGATFRCPECGSISRVTRTKRFSVDGVVRERVCLKGHKFETREVDARAKVQPIKTRRRRA